MRYTRYLVLAGAIAVTLYACIRKMASPTVMDDALMFYRYAYNWWHGGTIGFNLGERTYGCTSLTYLALVTAVLGTLGEHIQPQKIVTLCSLLSWAAGITLCRTTFRGIDRDVGLKGVRHLMTVCLVLAPIIYLHVDSGMDTGLAFAANAALLAWAYSHRASSTLLLITGLVVLGYFSFLTRPDNAIYAMLFPFLWLWLNRSFQAAGWFGIILMIVLLMDTLWKIWYFGDPLPLPFYAKSKGFYEGYIGVAHWPLATYYGDFVWQIGSMAAGAWILTGAKRLTYAVVALLLPVVLTVLYLANFVQIMGFHARFLVPGIPFVVVAAYLMIAGQKTSATAMARWLELTGLAYLGILALVIMDSRRAGIEVGEAIAAAEQATFEGNFQLKREMTTYYDGLDSLLARLPETATVALTEHGYPGVAHPKLYIIDLCGLHNAALAKNGWSPEVLRSRPPELIWVHPDYIGLRSKLHLDSFIGKNYQVYYNLIPGEVFLLNHSKPFLLKQIIRQPFVCGTTRNGIRALEGLEFTFHETDSAKLHYLFKIVNWRDKFPDLSGTVEIDSSTLHKDTFFIKNENGLLVPAVKLHDNSKAYPIWIGINKTGDFTIARVFEKHPNELKEISYGSLWAK